MFLGGLVLLATAPWGAFNVTWDTSFATGVSISQSGLLTKTSASTSWNAGAFSALTIPAAGSSMAFRFTIAKSSDTLSAGFIGNADYSSDMTRLSSGHTLAGFDFQSSQRVSLFHSGYTRSYRAGYQVGDVFDLVLTAQGAVEYRRNSVVIDVGPTIAASAYPLRFKVEMNTQNAHIYNVQYLNSSEIPSPLGLANGTAVSWTGITVASTSIAVNATIGSLEKVINSAGWNTGSALSNQAITATSEARGVSFLIGRELKIMTVGLVNRDRLSSSQSSIADEVLFGFSLQSDGRIMPIDAGGVKQRFIGVFGAGTRLELIISSSSGNVEYYRDGVLAYVSSVPAESYYPLFASCKANSYQALLSSAYFVSAMIPTVGYPIPSNQSAIRFTAYDPTAFSFSTTTVNRLSVGFRSITASDLIITPAVLAGTGPVNGMDFVVPSNTIRAFVGLARVLDDATDSYSGSSMNTITKILYGMYLDVNRRVVIRDVMGQGYSGGFMPSDRLGLRFVNGTIVYVRNDQLIAQSQPVNSANFPLVLRIVLYDIVSFTNVVWVNDPFASTRAPFTQNPGEAVLWTGYDSSTLASSPNSGVVTATVSNANLASTAVVTGFDSIMKGVEFYKDSCNAIVYAGFSVLSGDGGGSASDFGFLLHNNYWVYVRDGSFGQTNIRMHDDNTVFRLVLNPITQHVEYYKQNELIYTSRQPLPANAFPLVFNVYFSTTTAIRNVTWLGMSALNPSPLSPLSPVKWSGAGTEVFTYYTADNTNSSVSKTRLYNNGNRLSILSKDALVPNQLVKGFRFRILTFTQFYIGLVPTDRDRGYWNDEGEFAYGYFLSSSISITDNYLRIRGDNFFAYEVNDMLEIRFNNQGFVEFTRNGRIMHVSDQVHPNTSYYVQVTTWDYNSPLIDSAVWIAPANFSQQINTSVGQKMKFVNYDVLRLSPNITDGSLTKLLDNAQRTAYSEYIIHANSLASGFSFSVNRSLGTNGLGFCNYYTQQNLFWLVMSFRNLYVYELGTASNNQPIGIPIGARRDSDVFKLFINPEGRFVIKRNDTMLYTSRNAIGPERYPLLAFVYLTNLNERITNLTWIDGNDSSSSVPVPMAFVDFVTFSDGLVQFNNTVGSITKIYASDGCDTGASSSLYIRDLDGSVRGVRFIVSSTTISRPALYFGFSQVRDNYGDGVEMQWRFELYSDGHYNAVADNTFTSGYYSLGDSFEMRISPSTYSIEFVQNGFVAFTSAPIDNSVLPFVVT